MNFIRTPDAYFDNLPDFPFAPHYIEGFAAAPELRLHYLDEGSREPTKTFLCLHGEPTWCYLYRRMIPDFAKCGRVIVPDLIGFGRSDKPLDVKIHTFTFHRQILLDLIIKLDLKNITLVCQDWGGLLGLTLPMSWPDRFKELIVMNTALATAERPAGEGFMQWQNWVRAQKLLDMAALLKRACPHLSAAETAAYAAPFPTPESQLAPLTFPLLVPLKPEDDGAKISRRARDWWKNEWNGTTKMIIGMQDPVLTPPSMHALARVIRGCPAPIEIAEAGHFVQEWGPFDFI